MSFKYNGTSIEAVVFNDERITQLYYNDTLMWENPLFYNLLDDGSGYSVRLGNSNVTGDIMIAETFNGKPVVAIAKDAFKNGTGITSLFIPNSITSIGSRFLEGCNSLVNLTIPFMDDTLHGYYGSLIQESSAVSSTLTNITITGGTSICNSAFSGCKNITTINITGTNITNIGSYAFYQCSGLKEVNIPSSVISIGDNAFTGCKELTTIIIPDNVATIGGNAFGGCSKATIYCEAASQPSGWHNRWNGIESTGNAVPAYFYAEHTSSVGNGTYWHYVNGVPTAWKHSYASTVIAPTCTENGYTNHTCSVCGYNYKDNYITKLGHNYSIRKVSATCTEQGYDINTCVRCGDTYQSNYTNALGHTYGEWTITLEPTCTKDGSKRRDCTKCDHFETATATKLGHNYVSSLVRPTCTEQGYKYYECTRCKISYKDEFTNALGHDWVTATCDAPQTCKTCGATLGTSLGHNEVIDPAVPATCTTTGKTAGSHCSRCRKIFTPQQIVPATGHKWINATCTTAKTCSVCNITEGASLGHQWGAATYSWSDGEDGKLNCTATRACINDSTHIQTARANVTDKVTTQPTCDTAGVRTYYAEFEATWCTSKQTTRTIPATGKHTWGVTTITRHPTCTTTGTKTSTCMVCNAPLFEVIPATGNHTPGNWEITLEPTTTSTGTRVKKCTQCQQVQQTETIPKITEYNLTITINKTTYAQPGSGATVVGNVASINGTVASKIKSNETLTYKLIPTTTKTGRMKLTAAIVEGNANCTLVADDTSRSSYTLTIKDATTNLKIGISGSAP